MSAEKALARKGMRRNSPDRKAPRGFNDLVEPRSEAPLWFNAAMQQLKLEFREEVTKALTWAQEQLTALEKKMNMEHIKSSELDPYNEEEVRVMMEGGSGASGDEGLGPAPGCGGPSEKRTLEMVVAGFK